MADEAASKPPSNVRSGVWAFFESHTAQGKATCQLCAKSLSYKAAGGTTSNLLKHLTSQHPIAWRKHNNKETSSADVKPFKRGPLDGFVRKMTCPAGRAGQITDAIVDLVALDLRPASIVKGEGFCRLIRCLEPGYRVPSVTHITALLRKKHEEGRARLRQVRRVYLEISIM